MLPSADLVGSGDEVITERQSEMEDAMITVARLDCGRRTHPPVQFCGPAAAATPLDLVVDRVILDLECAIPSLRPQTPGSVHGDPRIATLDSERHHI